MQSARMFGNYVNFLAEENRLSHSDLSRAIGCSDFQMELLLKGRAYASFGQVSKLAELFHTTVEKLLSGDPKQYNATVVHCMNDFQNSDNREKILDFIDDYVDVVNAVDMHHQS